jgi:hypothetical protein
MSAKEKLKTENFLTSPFLFAQKTDLHCQNLILRVFTFRPYTFFVDSLFFTNFVICVFQTKFYLPFFKAFNLSVLRQYAEDLFHFIYFYFCNKMV